MTYYDLASENVALEIFDGEAVMIDLATGRYFALSPSASSVVLALTSGFSNLELVAKLKPVPQFDEHKLDQFIQEMLDFSLLKSSDQPKTKDGDSTPKPEFPTVFGDLSIEVYDDMADLIFADPIHDVEEDEGWPVLKKAG